MEMDKNGACSFLEKNGKWNGGKNGECNKEKNVI